MDSIFIKRNIRQDLQDYQDIFSFPVSAETGKLNPLSAENEVLIISTIK
jgi:hypothetical protein